jgi:hypothetical protein
MLAVVVVVYALATCPYAAWAGALALTLTELVRYARRGE